MIWGCLCKQREDGSGWGAESSPGEWKGIQCAASKLSVRFQT